MIKLARFRSSRSLHAASELHGQTCRARKRASKPTRRSASPRRSIFSDPVGSRRHCGRCLRRFSLAAGRRPDRRRTTWPRSATADRRGRGPRPRAVAADVRSEGARRQATGRRHWSRRSRTRKKRIRESGSIWRWRSAALDPPLPPTRLTYCWHRSTFRRSPGRPTRGRASTAGPGNGRNPDQRDLGARRLGRRAVVARLSRCLPFRMRAFERWSCTRSARCRATTQIDTLRTALQDDVADVRWNAAVALARKGNHDGVPVLRQMLDRAVRRAGGEARCAAGRGSGSDRRRDDQRSARRRDAEGRIAETVGYGAEPAGPEHEGAAGGTRSAEGDGITANGRRHET